MADFNFLKNSITQKWVISAPRRAKRTNVGNKSAIVCPFCPGQAASADSSGEPKEEQEKEVYRVPESFQTPSASPLSGGEPHITRPDKGGTGEGFVTKDSNWHIRVVANRFPFAPTHEIIIHSPDHHKNFDELPFSQVELILQTYRHRYLANAKNGQVYIFHNRGGAAGESLPHPHTQLVVIPDSVKLEIPELDGSIYKKESGSRNHELWSSKRRFLSLIPNSLFMIRKRSLVGKPFRNIYNNLETEYFLIFCPDTSDWPDEVWVAPKRQGEVFGTISDHGISDLAFALSRIIQIFDLRHGHEFPFNFYIYPGKNWYLRLIPRIKILGGFELGTNVMVNTQNPKETFAFIREHFWEPDTERIKGEHKADYWRNV